MGKQEEKDLFRVFDNIIKSRERCFDVKELRIGSHIMFNGLRNRVVGIEIEDDENAPILIKTLERIENKTIDMALEPNEIDPIPITDELLKELEFERLDDLGSVCYMKDIENYNVAVIYDRGHKCFMAAVGQGSHGKFIAACKHLHQLENVVYMATRKELVKD